MTVTRRLDRAEAAIGADACPRCSTRGVHLNAPGQPPDLTPCPVCGTPPVVWEISFDGWEKP
jgi:hypothetical protein